MSKTFSGSAFTNGKSHVLLGDLWFLLLGSTTGKWTPHLVCPHYWQVHTAHGKRLLTNNTQCLAWGSERSHFRNWKYKHETKEQRGKKESPRSHLETVDPEGWDVASSSGCGGQWMRNTIFCEQVHVGLQLSKWLVRSLLSQLVKASLMMKGLSGKTVNRSWNLNFP